MKKLLLIIMCSSISSLYTVDAETLVATNKGDSFAQNLVGIDYETGIDVKQNITETVKCYEKSPYQGNLLGQYNLGVCYQIVMVLSKIQPKP